METKGGTVANFREHVHRRGENGALLGYESIFDIGNQPVRLMLTEPAPISDGDDVEVEGRLEQHYLLGRRYTNHTRSLQGTGKRWLTSQQRVLMTCGMVVLSLLALACVIIGFALVGNMLFSS